MAKQRGSRLGSYEILALIGVGGMGEVYRARDPKLQRDVAIKILPDELTEHADRRARFEREARLLASLNHQNIGAIYGLEESDGELGLVLELVDGPTLAERLSAGAVPLKAALGIATQIAAALEAAHEIGIVHRDLKPQNIKLRSDGSVKVLDFGLAKTLDRAATDVRSGSPPPTLTSADLTRAGTVLGTPAYMSPEQMHGHAIDRRADVWAFGCVLYELLTGRRAFGGDDLPGTIAAVLGTEPNWDLLPAEVPTSVRTVLGRCLEKDAARRLRDIGDVRIMLEDASLNASPALESVDARKSLAVPSVLARRATVIAAAGGVLVLMLAAITLYLRPEAVPQVGGTSTALEPLAAEPVIDNAERSAGARLPNSIAVLPLDNLSPNPDDAYFAAGLHEEILNQLAKLRNLSVISRSSVSRYAENRPPIPEIAAQLRVAAVMEGSVRYAGNQLMVTAQLIDANTDSHLWSDTFRADRTDVEQVFAIQIEIATAIARALGAEITAGDRARIDRAPTASAAAYARYLRARDHGFSVRFDEAVRELDMAVALDPNFAEAYAHRAYVYVYGQVTSNSRVQLLRDERFRNLDFETLTLSDAGRALELYPGTGLAWAARALTHQFHFRSREARDAFARALELSPHDASILSEYALYHLYRGELDEALAKIRLAAQLDPNGTLTLVYAAQIAQAAGRLGEANDAIARALDLEPTNVEANLLAGIFGSDSAAAERYLRTAEALAADSAPFYLIGVANGYRRLALEADATRALDRYFEWASNGPIGAGDWAQYYFLRGDLDRLHDWVETAVEKIENDEADAGFIALQRLAASTDPRLSEQRFRPLIERLRQVIAD
jgi:serine/threonine protein kinase/Tfp pilus assembly protein PilF